MYLLVMIVLSAIAGGETFSPKVTLSSEAVVVYNYTTDHCPNGLERLSYDVADGPPRTFRSPKNRLYLQFASVGTGSRGQQGAELDSLKHSCHVYCNSTRSMNTSLFSSHEMPFSPWVSEKDGVVYALTDMEFHNTTAGFGGICLYVATTLFKSTDGGLTFQHAAPAPAHVVAAMPYPPANESSVRRKPPYMPAFRAPGNIVQYQGYLYATISALWGPEPYGPQQQGVCIMRTADITDPASWRGWNGKDFSARMQAFWWENPNPAEHSCKPVLPSVMTHSTIFFSSVYKRYVILGTNHQMYFSFDLVNWSNATHVQGETEATGLYSFVIDPSQTGPNFQEVGDSADFYYVASLGAWPAGRNVLRRSVHFA
eukprot:scpid70066/ scgid25241/ 